MSKITEAFQNKKAFIPFITCGDPDLETTKKLVLAMAQAGAVAILSEPENKGKTAYFAGISQARFKQKVIPGDVLTLELEIIKQKGPVGVGRGTAKVDGKLAASAELTFAIGDGK